jgi:hypothetical protein
MAEPTTRRASATLVLAVEQGLLLDVLGTGDRERVRAAHDALLRLTETSSSASC